MCTTSMLMKWLSVDPWKKLCGIVEFGPLEKVVLYSLVWTARILFGIVSVDPCKMLIGIVGPLENIIWNS